jgi:hypothetical protein
MNQIATSPVLLLRQRMSLLQSPSKSPVSAIRSAYPLNADIILHSDERRDGPEGDIRLTARGLFVVGLFKKPRL